MNREWYEEGKYEVMVEFTNEGILNNMSCTCHFSSLYPNNFKEGNQLCKHQISVLKRLYEKGNPEEKII